MSKPEALSGQLARPVLSDQERLQRKRPRDHPTYEDNKQQPAAKRRKAIYASYYSPRFWDTLSKVPLTRRALLEFDRRTGRRSSAQTARAGKIPATRRRLRSDTRRLLQFASNGGPDLSKLRGYHDQHIMEINMSQSNSQRRKRSHASSTSKSSATGKTKSTTPYDAAFEQKLIDRGVYPKGYRMGDGSRPPKPENVEEIREILARSRSSLSPSTFSEGAFEEFQDGNEQASSESKVMAEVIPAITGPKDKQHKTAREVPFYRLHRFDPELSAPKPDMYYGAQPEQIDARVRRDLDAYIIPSSRAHLPAAPNCFLEAKSASGGADVAQRQAMYDGAVGARGMWQLQNYGNPSPSYDGNAYTIASTYHPSTGTMQMYAVHPRKSARGETEYYTTQLRAYTMTDTAQSFRMGAAAYRNARDWAKEQRDRLIADANSTAQRTSTETRSFSMSEGDKINTSSVLVGESVGAQSSQEEIELNREATKRQRRQRQENTDPPNDSPEGLS